MRIQLTAISLACTAMLAACGGGSEGGSGGDVQLIDFPFPGGPTMLLPPDVQKITLKATASSGGPVTYTSNTPAVCSVSESTLTLLKKGSCSVTATQAGFEGYAPVSQRQLFVVPGFAQTIDIFRNPGAQALDSTPVQLAATSSSGRPVTFASETPKVCTVSGNTMSKIADGLCTVVATQDGGEYYASPTMKRDIPIGTASAPELTFLTGYTDVNTTKQLGTVGQSGNQWWCADCERTVSADGSSYTMKAMSNDPPGDWWASQRAQVWMFAANLKELSTIANTPFGLRIDAQAALKFNLAQNTEWFSTGANGMNIELFLGHFNLKDSKPCNVTLKATIKPSTAAATNYSVRLKDQFTISEDCGLAGLDLWTELQDYPISQIKFSVVKANAEVKTPGSNYQTQYTLTGPITFQ